MTDMNKAPTLTDEELAPPGVPFLPDGQTLDVDGVVTIGAAWDPSARGTGGWVGKLSRKLGADLDNVAVLFQDQQPVTLVAGWEPHKNPLHGLPGDGSVTHTGDNRTGDAVGDDESVRLNLAEVPAEFHRIVVQVAAFKGKNKGDEGFQGASNVLFSVYDGEYKPGVRPAFCIRPALDGEENCVIVCVLDRKLTADGRPTVKWTLAKSGARVKVKHGDQKALIRAAAAAR